MQEAWVLLAAAYGADVLIGDPVYRLHPVRLIGHVVSACERVLRALRCTGLLGGALLAVVAPGCIALAYLLLRSLCLRAHPYAAVACDLWVVYSCLALQDMVHHARPVATALEAGDLPAARKAVQRIVGRDAAVLDAPGVARAAVESVAESFVDGFFAPVCWFVAGALVAHVAGVDPLRSAILTMLVYRTVNTLDSMVGYRDERYLLFGRCSARLDDVLNFIPARLSLLILSLAASSCRLDSRSGWRVARRDRLKHESPNSAHTESFAAGALGLKLGGPLRYADGLLEKPWLGDGTPLAQASDIRTVCRFMQWAGAWSIAAGVLALWLQERMCIR